MRVAIVKDKIVINVIEVPDCDEMIESDIADIGDKYTRGEFVKPKVTAE